VLARVDLVALGHHGLQRRGGGQHGRDVLEAGGALVDAVVGGEGVVPARPLAHQQHPDAGRPAPLVGRERGGVPGLGQGKATSARAGVDEERCVGLLAHGGEGLEGADLVVGRLAGHHCRQGRDLAWQHPTEVVDRHGQGLAAPARGVQHRRVLDRRVREREAVAQTPCREPQQAQVRRMGAARSEGHLVGTDPESLGRGPPGVVEQEPRLATGTVQPTRVGVPPVERGEEHLAGSRVQRRGGGAVEVGRPGHGANLCHRLCHRACHIDRLGPHPTLPPTV